MLLVDLPSPTNIIIHRQQQEALATQEDTRTPTTAAACGQVVEGLVELNSNLNCSGEGLIVGGDDTTIRLNGHTIRGPGPDSSKVGISVGNQDSVRIEGPGTIEQFQAGILASVAEDTSLTSTILRRNQIAVFSTGTEGLQAMQNIITQNSIGVASHSSSGLQLIGNVVTDNQLAGITFVATDNSLMSNNNIMESQNGIFTDAESNDNRIESNEFDSNLVDLNNDNGLATNVNSNAYSDNKCETSNPSGLCTTAINALQPEQNPEQSTQEQEQEGKDKIVQKEDSPPSSSDRFQTGGIDWMSICNTLQPALYSSCSSLVASDGTLTYEGERALGCIRNGAALAFAAGLNSIPLDLISRGLQALEGLTGCGGIVNWNMVNQIASVAKILSLIPLP